MVNKINNDAKQKEFLKRNLKTIIITYSIFAISVFILAVLKKYSVISSNFSLIPFYLIMAILDFGIMTVLVCQMYKVCRKKEPGVSLCLGFIGIFLLVAFGIAIDVRKELIDFSKNATKIDALVYKDVDKDITKHKDTCVGKEMDGYCYIGDKKTPMKEPHYEIEYIYHLRYVVNGEEYTTIYKEKESKEFDNEQWANSYNDSKYKKNDYITIYYDNDNPEKIKGNFALGFGMVYFFEVIAILFQIIYFIKHKKYMQEVVN